MLLPVKPPLCRRAASCLAALTIAITPPAPLLLHGPTPALWPIEPAAAATVAPPSAESQASLRKAFSQAQAGLYSSADKLLSESIAEWERTKQPSNEIAALYKTRGGVRLQGDAGAAVADLSRALSLMQPESTPASERLTTYQLRARANGALGKTKEQEADLSEAIALLDQVDAISATNPYAYEERAKARMKLGEFPGAADDLQVAEVLFKDTGDKIRRALAAADGALAAYGAGDVERGVELMRGTFKVKRTLATNNPDDIVLLQELSRRDAELHIAYAAHLFTEQGALLAAARQWESGCVRLETYVVDGQLRFDEERRLQAKEAASAEATGTEQVLRSESVRSPFEAADDFRARLNGLDPRSPFVTQRPGTQYFWYKTGEGEVERRDPGNQLRDRERDVAIGLSCTAFRDPAWVARYRPEWPPNLAARMKTYAQEVELPAVPLPPKGAPPTRGELEF